MMPGHTQEEGGPLAGPRECRAAEGINYPIAYLVAQFEGALDDNWEIDSDDESITITSSFKLYRFSRMGTSIPKDPEELENFLTTYQIRLVFAPMISAEEYAHLAETKRSLRPTAAKTKEDWWKQMEAYEAVRLPTFIGLDHMTLLANGPRPDVNEIGGWICYLETTDHSLALFKPLATYQKGKAAEAVLRTYFLTFDDE